MVLVDVHIDLLASELNAFALKPGALFERCVLAQLDLATCTHDALPW